MKNSKELTVKTMVCMPSKLCLSPCDSKREKTRSYGSFQMVFNYNPSVTTWPRSVVGRPPLQRREVLRTHLCSATLGCGSELRVHLPTPLGMHAHRDTDAFYFFIRKKKVFTIILLV